MNWNTPDYYPLEQAIVKSGNIYNGDAEGAIVPMGGMQNTYGPQGGQCGQVYTIFSDPSLFGNATASLCQAGVSNNFDLSVNYCSVCL